MTDIDTRLRPGRHFPSIFWTPERRAQAFNLIGQIEKSFSQAAKEMGCTKNMLIGLANRAGIIRRDGTRPPTIFERLPDLPDLRGCRFPHGDPGQLGFRFCGEPVAIPPAPYCPKHMRICHQRRPEA